MKSLVLCLAVTLSFSTLANGNITEKIKVFKNISVDLEVYGQETKYEVLKNAYKSARSIPDPLDFEEYDSEKGSRSQKCVVTTENNPEVLTDTVVARYSVIVPGTAGNGPIFPGTADEIQTKVLLGADGVFQDKNFKVFVNETTNTDFMIKVQKNRVGVYSDIGGNVNIYFRKEKNYFPFKVAKLSNNKESVLYYGYCFSK